jgi:3-ketosteroid 9alpha-monooxygenase subunit B
MREYYQVPVAEVVRETGDACSLVLDVPPSLAATFAYRPGQFVTVRIPSDRTGSVARCYSLSSSPLAGGRPAITVKRTSGGYASNWILDHVTAGAALDLLPPAGMFSPQSLDGDFLLFAAGSGITPVISILKSALAAGRGRIVLVYANRDEHSVIFGPELGGLAADAGGRLVVVHWLDSLLGMHTFWPVSRQPPSAGSARVRSEARSEPASGSLNSWHQVISARRVGPRNRSR